MRVCIVCRSEPPLDDIVAVVYRGRVIDWCVCLPCHQREQGIPPAAFGRSGATPRGQAELPAREATDRHRSGRPGQ